MAVEQAARAATGSPLPNARHLEFAIVGTNHRHAPIHVRERLARDAWIRRLMASVEAHASVSARLLLSTCNRIELWFLGTLPDPLGFRHELASSLDAAPETFYIRTGSAAIEHAVRVASGMDSMAWGEPQIGAQVLESLSVAEANGWTERELSELVRKVSAAAGHIRRAAHVPVNTGSAGDAAVNLILSRLSAGVSRVLVVGTGKMGRLAARRLASSVDLTISDRSPAKADTLAHTLGARSLPLSESVDRLREFDAVIVATSAPRAVLTAERVTASVATRAAPILVIDLSVPRNVDPEVSQAPGVELLNLDDLEPWATPPEGNILEHAEDAIRLETGRLTAWLRSRAADDTVARLRERAEAIRREELSAASRRLPGLPPEARAVLEKMTERIVNRLLHDPTQAIRAKAADGTASKEYARLVRNLFGLREDAQ